MSENEVNFIEEIGDPHSQMQQQFDWPTERAFPHSSVCQLGSGFPSQTPPSQLDSSNSNISTSET